MWLQVTRDVPQKSKNCWSSLYDKLLEDLNIGAERDFVEQSS